MAKTTLLFLLEILLMTSKHDKLKSVTWHELNSIQRTIYGGPSGEAEIRQKKVNQFKEL